MTELHQAAAAGDFKKVEELLTQQRCGPNLRDADWGNKTALHWAAREGRPGSLSRASAAARAQEPRPNQTEARPHRNGEAPHPARGQAEPEDAGRMDPRPLRRRVWSAVRATPAALPPRPHRPGGPLWGQTAEDSSGLRTPRLCGLPENGRDGVPGLQREGSSAGNLTG
ncbi:uncharacterized protein LOC101160136 isoform X1 [Oryzias latipes]|uniref:uncharacterized protein LOC101160136 isoform X1 n=1 Tax=Oryzias latipes TaxID=8090 RepID=UPI0009DB47FD|nr:uncharacterized protein LOC101160136 isoform X1 [Oryzias latipes]